MIRNKISDSIYEIYVEKFPDEVELSVYRGDYFSFSLIGFNQDDAPWDFSIYDLFRSQLRLGDPRNPNVLYEFPPESFVMGKTDEGQNEYDELHLLDIANEAIDRNVVTWLDIQGIIGNEIKTFIKVRLNVVPDVTRD